MRLVDADEGGSVVLPVAEEPGARAPVLITSGSARFREFADGGDDASWSGLAVHSGSMASSEALARTRNAVWVAPGVLVAVVPGNGESGLARIELP